MLTLRPDRIRKRLELLGLNENRASELATGGKSRDLVRKILKDEQRGTNYAWTLGLAAALQCSVEYLSGASDDVGAPPPMPERASRGKKPPATDAPRRAPVSAAPTLPVRYVVQAGAWLEVDNVGQDRIAGPPVSADPAFPRDAQWLELVRGDSADLFYPEGIYVHVVDAVAIGYAPRQDDFVVVERRRHQGGLIERSLKQIAIAGRRIELWPRSRNPKWKAPLDLKPEKRADDDVVEISALVIGGYLPARRNV